MPQLTPDSRLNKQITVASFSRLVINTARRFMYPFAPVLSRGLGVPITAITSLIAINQFSSLLSPFFGPLGDKWGYRVMILAGLWMTGVGMAGGGIFPFYAVIVLAMLLSGLGKSIYDPALQAYVGQRVPYERRGRVIGVIETSWAGSTLIGIPLMGLLIEQAGWRAPFFVLGGLSIIGAVVLARLISKAEALPTTPHQQNPFWHNLKSLFRYRTAVGVLIYTFCFSAANDNLFVVYGVWLEQNFGLSVVALGVATMTIGLAELTGEGLTVAIADRVGLKRSIIFTMAVTTVSYLILPFIGHSLTLTLLGLFLIFAMLEYTIVAGMSLFTEILPSARATMMSAYVAAAGLGRVVGALLGGPVWLLGGITAISLVSMIINGLGLAALVWGLWKWKDSLKKTTIKQ